MPNLLKNLNSNQKKAVLHYQGPALVLAGAGSGKTRVLTTRVAHLIETRNVQPQNILLVTFTNKAAHEMNKRVLKLTGFRLPLSGTFHSLCAKILRIHGHKIGLSHNYVIYDSLDQLALIKQIYQKISLDAKEYNLKAVHAAISNAKNKILSASKYEKIATNNFQKTVARVYKLYEYNLKKNQAVDFDDLLLYTIQLFREDKETLTHYQTLIHYVLVDEYQDVNKAQYCLTKYFAQEQNNLFVVGDFAQSIYAWRGADYHNMIDLKKDFSGLKEYHLEQNYRSTQNILNAATDIISQNSSHPILKLWTKNTMDTKITYLETSSGEAEATEVLRKIKNQLLENSYADIAILYRTNAQSRLFEEACVKWGVPYQLIGGFKFYERKEIKDLLAYLKVALNPNDTLSKVRALKIGKHRFQAFQLNLQNEDLTCLKPAQLLEKIILATTYKEKFDSKNPADLDRLTNIDELLNVASQFDDINLFLENVALVQDNQMSDLDNSNKQNAITMMSLHSAKGLEFPIVFMVGLEEGLLPHSRSMMEKDRIEEERRLCYVGITRAKEKLFLTTAQKRFIYGSGSQSVPSRFLQDINPNLIKKESKISYDYIGEKNGNNKWFYRKKPQPQKSTPTKRRLVIDDDILDSVLSGEMDLDSFLEFEK